MNSLLRRVPGQADLSAGVPAQAGHERMGFDLCGMKTPSTEGVFREYSDGERSVWVDSFEGRDGFIIEVILICVWIRADDGGGSHVLAFACDACAAPACLRVYSPRQACVFAFCVVLAFDFSHMILLDLDYMQNMPGVKVFLEILIFQF